jgi:subtilisin family serine protease
LKINLHILSYILRSGILAACILLCAGEVRGEDLCFRVYLGDKGESGYSLDRPDGFLSGEAVDRRARGGIAVDLSDLPISQDYLDTLASLGAETLVVSKWMSTVVVRCPDSTMAGDIRALRFVDSIRLVHKNYKRVPQRTADDCPISPGTRLTPADRPQKSAYGYAREQISTLNGIRLHKKGYRGDGMTVAVIDAGFMNADRMTVFDSIRLGGTYNVVYPGESVFADDDHGTKVLSCMAAGAPGVMTGTAPEATYWLIKSEDNNSEYPVEEDYWAAAVEFADSVGVSVITSSLGYFRYDDSGMGYLPSMLDGRTAHITRVAQRAADKGLLLVVSAGNEGGGSWGKLTFPSDARDVISVGSVTREGERSVFSSTGPSADGRIKPDVVALGTNCTVAGVDGNIHYSSGTSFSTPIVAGLAACLWQALPECTNLEIIRLIRQTSSRHDRADGETGYGAPDIFKAFRAGRN